jgi:hypothetical protein
LEQTSPAAQRLLHCCNTRDAIENESRVPTRSSLVIRSVEDQDKFHNKEPASNRLRRGNMDELIGRLAAKAGIDEPVAEKTIGIILGFLRNEGPSDKVQALIDTIPGAEAAIAASSGGGLSRLMGGGLMALGTKLMGLGLGWATFRTSRVNFSGSATTKSERIKWARSSQGHRASVSSLKALFCAPSTPLTLQAPFAYRVS